MSVNKVALGVLAAALFGAIASDAQTAAGTPVKSGFENNVTLSTVTGNGPSGNHQDILGTDLSTGYAWPGHPWGASFFAIHLDPQSGNTDLLSSHFLNSLDTMTGHTGASTKALHLLLSGYPDQSCCAQNLIEASGFTAPIKQEYFRVWMKFPSAFATQFSSFHDDFRMLWEWKTDNNMRTATEITNSGGTPIWEMQIDVGGRNCSGNSSSAGLFVDPNTGAIFRDCAGPQVWSDAFNTGVSVPINTWFLLEVWNKRSFGTDGITQLAINGQLVMQQLGANYGYTNEEIANAFLVNEYGSRFPMEEWIDDLEIRDSLPSGCSTFPCGVSENSSGTSSAAVPFMTSPRGAIGVVGQAFSYQSVSTPAATSYSASNLPSGLSINSSTGLISGTPSSAGRVGNVVVRAINSNGRTEHGLVFQINSAPSVAPTISSFTASPASINAGDWSQLQWAQSGATTLTLNPGNVNVTGRDPFAVNPIATTVYTLTAVNAAGSTSRSVTVTVSGSVPLPAISTFTATPSSVFPGGSSTLSWSTSGATSLSIDQSVGDVTGLTSRSVTPSVTTMYTLSATNTAGTTRRAVTVNVVAPLINSFTASPATISGGGSSTLSWSTSGATSLSINQGVGTVTGTSTSVSPSVTTSYTLSAINSVGTTTATATVTISVPSKTVGCSLILE